MCAICEKCCLWVAERGTIIRNLQGVVAMGCHQGEICVLFAKLTAYARQRGAPSYVFYRVWPPWDVMRAIYVRYLRELLLVDGSKGHQQT